ENFVSACLFTSANRAATGKRRGKFEYIRALPTPLPVKPTLTRAKMGIRAIKAIDATGRLQPTTIRGGTAEHLHAWIRDKFPANAAVLQDILELRARMFQSRSDPKYLTLSEQRDAAGLLLDIAGLDRADVLGRGVRREGGSGRSYLEHLLESN